MKQNDFIHVSIEESSKEGCAKRLRILLDMLPFSMEEFCAKYNFSPTTVKYWNRAKGNGLTGKGATRIVDAVHQEGVECNAIWLMTGKGSYPLYIDIRKNKSVKQSKILLPHEYYIKKINEEIELFCQSFENAIILQIYDDGMEPSFVIGDFVGGIQVYDKHIQQLVGMDCIVETENHQHLCRRITRGTEENRFNLVCTNQRTAVATPNQFNMKLNSAALISRYWKKEPFGIKK